jgi:vancomycin resistance protein YoaR
MKMAAAAVGALAVLLVGLLVWVGLTEPGGNGVLAGVSVEGRDMSGASRAELTAAVEELAAQRGQQEVRVDGEREEVTATRAEVGYGVAARDTVEDVWSRGRRGLFGSLADRVRARFGATIEVELTDAIDEEQVEAWSRAAAEQLSVQPRPAGVELVAEAPLGERVRVTEPAPGEVVDGDMLAERLRDALDGTEGPVRVEAPAELIEPDVVDEDLAAVLPDAERAVSAPIGLAHPAEGPAVELDEAALARVLHVPLDLDAPAGERFSVVADPEALAAELGEELLAGLATAPRDATFVIDGEDVRIEGGEPGFSTELDVLAEQVTEVALADGEQRVSELSGAVTPPTFTRADAEELGIVEQVSTFTTEHAPGEGRVTNIQRMADIVDGAIIRPGESFSLNDHVGPRTRDRGFVEGGVIEDGEFEDAVGGGVSQLATTFFNAAFFAGVELIEFQPHSYYISRYPMGRESTIYYGAIDVEIRNDSPHGILVGTSYTDTSITVSFYSTPWAEVETTTSEPYDRVPGAERDGFTVDFTRTVTYPDGTTETEQWTHTYEPEDDEEDDDEEDEED